eukprot:g6627.t1
MGHIKLDELPEPEPHEYCPPLNSVHLTCLLGHTLAKKAGTGTLEDFAASIRELRQSIDSVLPFYVQNEIKLAEIQSEDYAARKKAAAAERFKDPTMHFNQRSAAYDKSALETSNLLAMASNLL